MAVDTRDRRASCLGFAGPSRSVWPNPDGAISGQADRQHIAYSYPGILVSAAAALVYGTPRFTVKQVFVPGIVGGQVYVPGEQEQQAHVPGSKSGQE